MWLAPLLLLATSFVQFSVQQDGNTSTTFPGTVYPNASSPNPAAAADSTFSPPYYPSPWGTGAGDWASAYTMARAFVSNLTLLEKINLTTGVGWESERCVGETGSIPRIGFRAMCLQDSPVGVRDTDYNSVFPAGVNVAASWDRGLAYARGQAMGAEHAGKGVDVQLGPVAGPLGRSPEGGRNWEGFSPDPVLTGVLMAQTVQGIQSSGVMACAKHFIGNEQEHFRQQGESAGFGFNISDSLSSNIDDVTMHELYLWPFADAVRAGVATFMCSYQQVNNSYACQNSHMINYLLKAELGFQGFMMSDWGAQHSGVSSANAGLDMTMPGDTAFNTDRSYWGANLTIALLNGTVPQFRLDDAVTRIIAAWYFVGRDHTAVPVNFDSWDSTFSTYGYRHFYAKEDFTLINEHVDVRQEHGNLIREWGSASTVLLKNTNNVLPLTGKEKFTAVFGDDAGDNPLGPNGCPDRGCDNGTLGMAWGSGTANFPYLITPETAIQNEIVGNNGVFQSITNNFAASQIQALAGQASVAIVFVNADSGEGYIDWDGNIGDRNNLTFWDNGDVLVTSVSALCNNTILVIHSTGPVLVGDYKTNPNITAILWAGVPGEQSGNSIADVLYGRVNPTAKLPFTLAETREDYGTDILYIPNAGTGAPQVNFTEGVFIDYRALDRAGTTPVYEFGFGLSYTTFSYSNLRVTTVRDRGGYTPTTGFTGAAPTFGTFSKDPADYLFPPDIDRIDYYIYPYLNDTDLATASNTTGYGHDGIVNPGALDGSPQPLLPASGPSGGNPELYDVLYQVTATIGNTGSVGGAEVVQMYISLGGPYDPKIVLRGFEKLSIQPGMSTTFTADILRRDISNWDTVSQDWFISNYTKTVYVGSSSRNLLLAATLS